MMIFYKALMALTAVFCVFTLGQVQNRLLRVGVLMIIIGVLWVVVDNLNLPFLEYANLLYYAGILVFALYAVITRGISVKKRSVLLLMAFCVFTHGLFAFNHWPYANKIMLLQFLPLILYFAFVIRKRNEYKQELGPLTIFAADALTQVISYIRLMGGNNN